MTDERGIASTRNPELIKATPEGLYRAFSNPAALAVYLQTWNGEVHIFGYRVGEGS